MPEENETLDNEPGCETDRNKPTITIAEKDPAPADAPKPTITIAEREDGDLGLLVSPDGWDNPWDVKKEKK